MNTDRIDIDALPGERWFAKESSSIEEMKEYWGGTGAYLQKQINYELC